MVALNFLYGYCDGRYGGNGERFVVEQMALCLNGVGRGKYCLFVTQQFLCLAHHMDSYKILDADIKTDRYNLQWSVLVD